MTPWNLAALLLACLAPLSSSHSTMASFKRLEQIQFIAAKGYPATSSGAGADDWGIWRVDPGPRGVRLPAFPALAAAGGVARAGWTFDAGDWWLEEHGLIMEKPDFPLPAGRYLVSGDREVTTVLTVEQGGGWRLDEGTLHDVTHLPCRSARYTPAGGAGADVGSPANARLDAFPVTPGAPMPDVAGCDRQDYAVLFVLAVEDIAATDEL